MKIIASGEKTILLQIVRYYDQLPEKHNKIYQIQN